MTILFLDNFVDTNSTPLENHTPDTGTAWTLINGVSGEVVINGTNDTVRVFQPSTYLHSDDLTDADAYVKMSILAPSSADNDQYVAIRIQDKDNFIGVGLSSGGNIQLVKSIAGVNTILDNQAYTSLDVIEIRPSGTTIEWYINGALIDSFIVTEFATETKQGLISTTGGGSSSYLKYYEAGTSASGTTSAITGTAVPTQTEADIITGGKTIILTLTNDTFVAAGTGPIGSTADTQAIIDGLDSAQVEATGWNAEVRDKEVTTAVVRTSDTVCTITLTASALYNITATETITATIPAAVLVTSAIDVVSAPTFTVTHVVTVSSITTEPLKNNTGQLLASEVGVLADVYNTTDGTLVIRKTGLTSDVSGIVTFTDALISAATLYRVVITLSGNEEGIARITSV